MKLSTQRKVWLAWTITLLELGVERSARWVPKVAADDNPARARATKGVKASILPENEGVDVDRGTEYHAFKENWYAWWYKTSEKPAGASGSPATICSSRREGNQSMIIIREIVLRRTCLTDRDGWPAETLGHSP